MKYLTIEELTRSATATHLKIDNTPSEEAVKSLHHLVDNVLDPLREMWHATIIVTSGYRCEALNTAVHGAPYSYHRLGMAADIRPERGRLDGLYDLIQHLFSEGLIGLTECYINENKGYIHVAYDANGFNVSPFLKTTN